MRLMTWRALSISRRASQGLMGSARHVIKRIMNPRVLFQMASYDVASTIHQSAGEALS
jgi:hypothetical protein